MDSDDGAGSCMDHGGPSFHHRNLHPPHPLSFHRTPRYLPPPPPLHLGRSTQWPSPMGIHRMDSDLLEQRMAWLGGHEDDYGCQHRNEALAASGFEIYLLLWSKGLAY